jgi:hypothetical protein
MTINLLKDPVIDINKYLLAELYTSGALEESDYLVDSIQWKPIFPVQEPPEFSVSNPINPKTGFHGEPFLVYDVAIPIVKNSFFTVFMRETIVMLAGHNWLSTIFFIDKTYLQET